MQAVMLAAGRGTRLRPISDRYSKAMVPVVGRPLADRVLETLVVNGVRDVVMVIGPEDLEIRKYFTHRTALDVAVQFVVQEERLGMAHALSLAAPLIEGQFVLSACDSIKSVEHVGELLRAAAAADGALSLLDVPWELVCKSAPVELDGTIVRRIVEKPRPEDAPSNTVSLPLYVLPHRLLEVLTTIEKSPRGEYELQGAIQATIDSGARIAGVRAQRRFQVSTPADLLELSLRLMSSAGEDLRAGPYEVGVNSIILRPVRIGSGVIIGKGCRIGPEVSIESGAAIGDGGTLSRSVIMPGAVVPAGATLLNQVISS